MSTSYNWRDALSAIPQALAGVAGNQQLYNEIQQQRDQKQQAADQLKQASLQKVGLAQKKVAAMLASGTHPETGAPLSDIERQNLTQTSQTLNDYANQISTGQGPSKRPTRQPAAAPGGAPQAPQQPPQDPMAAVQQYSADIPANPYAQKYNQVRQAFPDIAPEEAMHMALGTAPKNLQDKLVAQWEKDGKTPQQIWDMIHPPKEEKAPKGLKPLEGGIGVKDDDTGTSYFPSQVNDPSIPQPARDMLKAQKAAKDQKDADETKKEDLRLQMQARTLGAAFERMGQSQQFQEAMTDFRSNLSTYRALDKQADDSASIIKGLKDQYQQPGNHAVADNELQNFYTTVVQKGGRKTAAEFALTAKIGSLGMNIDQAFEKAKSGQLPDPLRRELLSGMEAVAKEQRSEADSAKPELPEIPTRSGSKKKQPQSGGKPQSGNSKDPLGVL